MTMIEEYLENLYGSYIGNDDSEASQAMQICLKYNDNWKELDYEMSKASVISQSLFLKKFYSIMKVKIHYRYVLDEVLQKRYGFKYYSYYEKSKEKNFINPKYLPKKFSKDYKGSY